MEETLWKLNEVRAVSPRKREFGPVGAATHTLLPSGAGEGACSPRTQRAWTPTKRRAGRWCGGPKGRQQSSCLQVGILQERGGRQGHRDPPPSSTQRQVKTWGKMTMVTVSNNPPNVIAFYLISLFQERSRTASVCPSAEELCKNCLITFCMKVPPVIDRLIWKILSILRLLFDLRQTWRPRERNTLSSYSFRDPW